MHRSLFRTRAPLALQRALAGLLLACGAAALAQSPLASTSAGQRLYEEGVLQSGAPLQGQRADGTTVQGQAAACSNCHKRSGMGAVEGDIQVAPVSGRFLYPPAGERPLATMDPRIGKRMNIKRDPHTEASLALAIRSGVGSGGQTISPLMPRYALGDSDMQALSSYLHGLSREPSAGVQDRTIRFATVITPGVEPERKKAMLDMLRTAFMQKNGSTVTNNSGRRHMVSAAELVLGTENKWVLDVWELTGAPETWAAQLEGYNRLAPPFALVSGLGNGTWAPVEDFCEAQHIPCWFPSVAAAPARTNQPYYAFYFNQGLSLEADVLAQQLRAQKTGGRLLQLVRGSDASAAAAARLQQLLHGHSALQAQTLDLDQAGTPALLAQRLASLTANDRLVLWLRPADLRQLQDTLARSAAQPYASGTLLGGAADTLPEPLRPAMRLVYPYELPQQRAANVAYMRIWLKLRKLPLVDEVMQSEVYFALNFLTDTLAELLDNLYRDYLVERAENMIGQRESRKAEDEMRDQSLVRPRVRSTPMDAAIPRPSYAPGTAEHMDGVREGTTVYPRLTLGPGQRYASKGAYIVRYSENTPGLLQTDTAWIVP